MKVADKYLNLLKSLFNRYFLYDKPFIEFIDELNTIYPQVLKEITNNYIVLSPSEFTRYVKHELSEIKKIDFDLKDNNSALVEHWFSQFNSRYFNFDSIINYDIESNLYSKLSHQINKAPDDSLADFLFNLQSDFLKFTKAHVCNEIINYLEDKNELVNGEIKESKIKDEAWFQVGLLFATGEINQLQATFSNYTELARHKFPLNPKKYRPYISESFGGISKGSKNIFNSLDKLLKIKDHCEKSNISISKEFRSKIYSLQSAL